jgi:hypothetical protein
MTEDWVYSHSQLSKFRLCPTRSYAHYILGDKEPTTPQMAAGTWLLHTPVEGHVVGMPFDEVYWEMIWANFIAEAGLPGDYKSKLYSMDLARALLGTYKANPLPGRIASVEETFYTTFPGGYRYSSRADFILSDECEETLSLGGPGDIVTCNHPISRTTVDLKLKFVNPKYFKIDPLTTFDDQLLGQAICAGADRFARYTFPVAKDNGKVLDPIYEEHPVDPVLADRWRANTAYWIGEIETLRARGPHAIWPFNTNNCNAYARPCWRKGACEFGA